MNFNCRRGLGTVRDTRRGELVLKVPLSALITTSILLNSDPHLSAAVNLHPSLSAYQVIGISLINFCVCLLCFFVRNWMNLMMFNFNCRDWVYVYLMKWPKQSNLGGTLTWVTCLAIMIHLLLSANLRWRLFRFLILSCVFFSKFLSLSILYDPDDNGRWKMQCGLQRKPNPRLYQNGSMPVRLWNNWTSLPSSSALNHGFGLLLL